MDYLQKIIGDIEIHSVDRIKECFEHGVSPNDYFRNKPLIYEWETFIPSVNPISYAMMGLLPQFQRKEKHIYDVVAVLLKAAYGIDYQPSNVPNKYLNS